MKHIKREKTVVDSAREIIQLNEDLQRAYTEIERLKAIEDDFREMLELYTLNVEQSRLNTLVATIATITN